MRSLSGNNSKHDITVRRNGLIDMNARISRILDLHNGDVIDVVTDGTEFYLCVRLRSRDKETTRNTVSRANRGGSHFRCWSKKICRAILDECHAESHVRLRVGEPIDMDHYGLMLPIITKQPLP